MKKQTIWILAAATGAAIGVAGYIYAAASFVPDSEPTNYIAPIEMSNFDLSANDAIAFKTDFLRDGWSGNVFAYSISSSGAIDQINEKWTGGAGAILDAMTYTDRKIVTLKDGATTTTPASKVAFTATGISAAQLATLTVTGATTTQVLDFIRGDGTNEKSSSSPTGLFRDRQSALGDILHSWPYYTTIGGTPVLFVGANDGMLHVFNASSSDGATTGSGGKELWAYVPSMLIPKLNKLAADPYVHNYYVDGGLIVGDAVISGTDSRVLAGGLGAGGKGLYALNVTNPVPTDIADAASKILWEITPTSISNLASTTYANLGYTYGTPVVAAVNSGVSAVIVGNGYNSGAKSSLFVINAATGALIKEIITSGAVNGGLSSPSCEDRDSNGTNDYCYAGDIDGKLWKFDLSGAVASTWSASELTTDGNTQAITMAPSVVAHPFGGYMVMFGTGNAFTDAEKASTTTNYMYGIWDGAPSANNTLLTQTLAKKQYVKTPAVGTTPAVEIPVRVVTTSNVPDWSEGSGHHRGWKVAMVDPGERILGDGIFTDSGRVAFNSTNTTVAATSQIPAVQNWFIELNYLTGGTLNVPFLNLNNDTFINDADRLKIADGTPDITSAGVAVGRFVSNGVGSQPIFVKLSSGRNIPLFNENPDVIPATSGETTSSTPTTTTTASRGVAGGHFDIDIFYPKETTNRKTGSSYAWDGGYRAHDHEYDDVYNVTGLDMIRPSDLRYKLSNIGIPYMKAFVPNTTNFKVLVHNQYLSPAVKIQVGSGGYVSAKLFQDQAKQIPASQTEAQAAVTILAAAPTYVQTSAGFNLKFNMPVEAFTFRDWWTEAGGGSTEYTAGRTSAGLHSTNPQCAFTANTPDVRIDSATQVSAISNGGNDVYFYNAVIPPPNTSTGPGTNSTTEGARHNGALTVQIIKANTTAAMLEMNVANRPEFGWRVKSANFAAQVLAEYIVYWHHPRAMCYGTANKTWKQGNNDGVAWNTAALMTGSGWTLLPPEDISPANAGKTADSNSQDPKGGSFTSTPATTITTTTGGTSSTTTQGTIASPGLGSGSTGDLFGGTANNGGGAVRGEDKGDLTATNARTGRVGWTELIKD